MDEATQRLFFSEIPQKSVVGPEKRINTKYQDTD